MAAIAKIPPITMSKLYVGNLPNEINENKLKQLFAEQNLSCTSILIKRGGYAFIDCPDQSSADRAIDKLNGFNYNGSALVVEPSVASGKKKAHPSFYDTSSISINTWMRASASDR
ncbi:unnamed protein product [Diabrotica balteata]|uniref:Insulin-like growth factor 2 mRNA-binding protein 3-A n=2 Tax=Diabrotica TaxID=50385 RepID=A0A6P7F6D8_DIAVI|nr:insulin-like growth factor 2 mRNA-binding protein 3-A [Diabrotica virgifera virgifera]CAG9832896.1 unnamed protein product [Diabrotica balteata]